MNITLTTTEPITIDGSPIPHEELQALVSKHKPKPKLRDGYGVAEINQNYWYINQYGHKEESFYTVEDSEKMLAINGNRYLIERNCDLTIEANNIHHDLIRWIDLHEARAKDLVYCFTPVRRDIVGKWRISSHNVYAFAPYKIASEELCNLFITENTDKLNRLKAIEEELSVSLYQ